jgi:hypothetical protein
VKCALPEIYEVCHTYKRARNGKNFSFVGGVGLRLVLR